MNPPSREVAPNIASLAALIGEPARAAMLWSLMGAQSRPAGELARIAGVSPQAASAHLNRLVEGELLSVESRGRHRFYCLSSPEAAAAIESLAAMATVAEFGADVVPLVPLPLRQARRCWGHLAGQIGVEIHDAMLLQGWINVDGENYSLSSEGLVEIEKLGIDPALLKPGRRGLAFACRDWSERRPHLGGPLARALLDLFLAEAWLKASAVGRQLEITIQGRTWLDHFLGGHRKMICEGRESDMLP